MQIIYSRTPIPDTGGIKAVNPAFFYACEQGVSQVFLNGDLPDSDTQKIKVAYGAIGVPVQPFDLAAIKRQAAKKDTPKQSDKAKD